VKNGGDLLRGQTFGSNPGIYWMLSDGGSAEGGLITEEGSTPLFNKKGDRIYLISNEGEKTALISVDMLGGNRRVHITSDTAQKIVPSPDDQWITFTERYNSYIATLPHTGQAIQIGPSTTDFPVKRLTRDAGMYIN